MQLHAVIIVLFQFTRFAARNSEPSFPGFQAIVVAASNLTSMQCDSLGICLCYCIIDLVTLFPAREARGHESRANSLQRMPEKSGYGKLCMYWGLLLSLFNTTCPFVLGLSPKFKIKKS